jgi:NADH-ubiquinone oxidoreductase chain 4
LFGGLFVCLFCIRQTDLKSLIAYSSVAHIIIVIGASKTWSFVGFVNLSLESGAWFVFFRSFGLSNISYEHFVRGSLLINKGLVNLMPIMTM